VTDAERADDLIEIAALAVAFGRESLGRCIAELVIMAEDAGGADAHTVIDRVIDRADALRMKLADDIGYEALKALYGAALPPVRH
jgi:hypothetical protein